MIQALSKTFTCNRLSSTLLRRWYQNSTYEFTQLKNKFEQQYIPMFTASNTYYWNASITGRLEDWNKVEESNKQINAYLSNKDTFAKLKAFRDSKELANSLLGRELETIYLLHLGYQVDTHKLDKMTTMSSSIERKFNVFRTEYEGKRLSDNDVLNVLKHSKDSNELKGVWEAQKKVAREVAEDINALVKLRNEVAKELGFDNYHSMSLQLSQQDPQQILRLFDELDKLTKNMFKCQKSIIDQAFEERYKIPRNDLKPWHYQDTFFQEAPKVYNIDYDKYYKGKNLEALTTDFYSGIGLDINSILKKSDLYQKEGKSQHAYCLSIDRLDDIRILCNNVDNARWMSTMLHEFGHALYEKYIDKTLPFMLREPPHIFTTEAIAMLFERLTKKASWINLAVGISEAEQKGINAVSNKVAVMNQLVFSRWAQVMFRFEKLMYENPEQNLNELWWKLVSEYQLIEKPAGRDEPDWAAKIHIAVAPCYYHNYLLGELLASQYNNYICKKVLGKEDILSMPYGQDKKVGQYLIEKVFKQGGRLPWWEMIAEATGEPLTPKYYAKELELAIK